MSDPSHYDISKAAPSPGARKPDSTRRRFLLAFGASAAGAASAQALAAAPAPLVEATETRPQSQGYQETEHVRRYYRSTRL